MKRTIIIICCIVLIISSLSGCDSDAVVVADNENYDLIKKGKELYLVIDESIFEIIDALAKYNDPKVCISYIPWLEFSSIEELIDIVKNGKLIEGELETMQRFFKTDSNGIKISDIFNLQVPVLPGSWEVQHVNLNSKSYSFHFVAPTGEWGSVTYQLKDEYDSQYERNYLNFFDQEHIILEKTVKNNNKTEYYYSTGENEYKNVRYTVKNGRTKLIVDETYYLSITRDDLPESDSIPFKVEIYGQKNKHYFYIIMYRLVEQPTKEWIKSFGIKDYE